VNKALLYNESLGFSDGHVATVALTRDNFEKVVLYFEPGALPPPVLEEVITQTRNVDMAAVHKKTAEGERSQR